MFQAEEDRLITISFSIDGESENTQTYYEEIRQLYYRVSMFKDLYTILTSQLNWLKNFRSGIGRWPSGFIYTCMYTHDHCTKNE